VAKFVEKPGFDVDIDKKKEMLQNLLSKDQEPPVRNPKFMCTK